jgi:hypothetical protein
MRSTARRWPRQADTKKITYRHIYTLLNIYRYGMMSDHDMIRNREGGSEEGRREHTHAHAHARTHARTPHPKKRRTHTRARTRTNTHARTHARTHRTYGTLPRSGAGWSPCWNGAL